MQELTSGLYQLAYVYLVFLYVLYLKVTGPMDIEGLLQRYRYTSIFLLSHMQPLPLPVTLAAVLLLFHHWINSPCALLTTITALPVDVYPDLTWSLRLCATTATLSPAHPLHPFQALLHRRFVNHVLCGTRCSEDGR